MFTMKECVAVPDEETNELRYVFAQINTSGIKIGSKENQRDGNCESGFSEFIFMSSIFASNESLTGTVHLRLAHRAYK